MNHQNPLHQFLSRADHLAIALDVQRALTTWDNEQAGKFSSPVNEVFSNPENIIIARAIIQHIKPIKNRLLLEFGAALHQRLAHLLANSPYQDSWHLRREYMTKKWTQPYAGSALFPKLKQAESPYLYILIQRNPNKINFGISRSEDRRQRPVIWDSSLTKELETYLIGQGFTRHTWWLGIKQLYDMNEDELWLAAASNLHSLVVKSADKVWHLLVENYELLTKMNEALAQTYLKQTV